MPLFVDAIGCIKSGPKWARRNDLKHVPQSYMKGFFYEAVQKPTSLSRAFKSKTMLPNERQKLDNDIESCVELMNLRKQEERSRNIRKFFQWI